jgi:hypothetical protein
METTLMLLTALLLFGCAIAVMLGRAPAHPAARPGLRARAQKRRGPVLGD